MKNKIKTVLAIGLLLFVFYANAYSQFLGCGKGCGLFQICPDPGYVIDWVGANVDFKAANNWQNLPMPRHYDLAAHIIQSSSNPSCYKLEWTSTHDYELVVKFAKVWTIRASMVDRNFGGYINPDGLVTVKEGENLTVEFGYPPNGGIEEVLVNGIPISLGTTQGVNYIYLGNIGGVEMYSFTFNDVQSNQEIFVEFE